MNLKDQVLSIDQVQELQELGFDINKYATLYWASCDGCSNEKCFERQILELNISKSKCCVNQTNIIPTLTIGDIIDILPKEIEEKVLNIFAFGETWSVGLEGIQYCGSNTLIDALFETLKWCIKEKHIEL